MPALFFVRVPATTGLRHGNGPKGWQIPKNMLSSPVGWARMGRIPDHEIRRMERLVFGPGQGGINRMGMEVGAAKR